MHLAYNVLRVSQQIIQVKNNCGLDLFANKYKNSVSTLFFTLIKSLKNYTISQQ